APASRVILLSQFPGAGAMPAPGVFPALPLGDPLNGGAGGARGRTVRGEFATLRAGWRTCLFVATPCSPSASVAHPAPPRQFATLSAVRNCTLPAPRPEIPLPLTTPLTVRIVV